MLLHSQLMHPSPLKEKRDSKSMLVRRAWLSLLAGSLLSAACGGRPDYSLRNAAPEVAFATAPPAYTATPSITLSVAATNPTGVKAIYALSGSQRWLAAQQEDGTWLVNLQLPVIGKNTITVWAEDTASPVPNSGQGMEAPYQLVQEVIYDPTPPSVTYDASFASYADERALQVAVDGNGIAVVPAAYSTLPKAGVMPGGGIYKAWSRLSAEGEMTASELETTNTRNIPVLRFAVPFNRNTDAPIEAPTYVAHLSCPSPCPDFPDATGQLLPAATTDDQRALFDLPLATQTVPALGELQGPAALSIALTVADAAGNSVAANGFNFGFHVIGPPLAVSKDTQYAAAAKPDSVYAYRLADQTYAALWQTGPQFPDYVARLARYIITNPIPETVALDLAYLQDPRGSWQAVESWYFYTIDEPIGANPDGTYTLDPNASKAYAIDGFTFHNPLFWRTPYGTMTGPLTQAEYGAFPCGAPSRDAYAAHRIGDRTAKYFCINALPGTPEVATFSSAEVSLFAYRVAAELQGQERAPDTDPSGRWLLVPPAAGGVPGTLVVYLARPVTASRTRALQWNMVPTTSGSAYLANHYQTWDYESWGWISFYNYPGHDIHIANRAGRYLARAQDLLSGTLAGTTQAYSGAGLLGEPVDRLSLVFAGEPLAIH